MEVPPPAQTRKRTTASEKCNLSVAAVNMSKEVGYTRREIIQLLIMLRSRWCCRPTESSAHWKRVDVPADRAAGAALGVAVELAFWQSADIAATTIVDTFDSSCE